METQEKKVGRPKSYDADSIAKQALFAYWSAGPNGISLSEVCRLTGSSKPSLYRAFGDEDGLLLAALKQYEVLSLNGYFAFLESSTSIDQVLPGIADFILRTEDGSELPKGCFFVSLNLHPAKAGEKTISHVQMLRERLLQIYRRLIANGQATGTANREFSDEALARFLFSIASASISAIGRGEPHNDIRNTLNIGFQAILR